MYVFIYIIMFINTIKILHFDIEVRSSSELLIKRLKFREFYSDCARYQYVANFEIMC